MQKAILITLFLGILSFCQAQNKLANIWSNKILHTASYSYYAVDAETGEVIVQSPQISLMPASVQKIATTAAALEILGPEFRFTTDLGYAGTFEQGFESS